MCFVEHIRVTASIGNKNAPSEFLLFLVKTLASFKISWLLALEFILNLPKMSQIFLLSYFQKFSEQVWEDNVMVNQIKCMYFAGTKIYSGVMNDNYPLGTQLE